MKGFDKYTEYTKSHNWSALCKLNNTGSASQVGHKKELKVLETYLEPDEVVFAFASGSMEQTGTSFDFGGTKFWLVVLTSERFLCLRVAMLTRSVNTQSIRLDSVLAVSASQRLMLGEIKLDLGSGIITIDNCQKEDAKVIADFANKLLKEKSNKKAAATQQSQTPAAEESSLDKLEKLAKLHSTGALSDEEFNEAKQKVLSSL